MTENPVRLASIAALVARLAPNERVFIQGSAGEISTLVDEMCAAGKPLHVTTTFVPGLNTIPVDRLPAGATFTDLFAHAKKPGDELKLKRLPLSYGALIALMRDRLMFDTCILQVSPPDAARRCSLGASVEFAPLAISRSRRLIGVINPQMPSLPNAVSVALGDFEAVAEIDAPLNQYNVGAPSAQAQRIAENVAAFVEDGMAIQVGIGKAPDALMRILTSRRKLRLHSGMFSDGARMLLEAGALDAAYTHTSCVHVGTRDYYGWIAGRPEFHVRGCDYTHDVRVLASVPGLVAVNSAISVDLLGQPNLETIGGRVVSGVGGAPDFARGASLSPGGISVIALPATSDGGAISRIVPSFAGPCSVPRADIDVVVTEFGAADLRGYTAPERAERLAEIAAPNFRADLRAAAEVVGKSG